MKNHIHPDTIKTLIELLSGPNFKEVCVFNTKDGKTIPIEAIGWSENKEQILLQIHH